MAERLSGKFEAIIAATILVVVVVLFAKYYEAAPAATPTPETANGKPASTKPVQ